MIFVKQNFCLSHIANILSTSDIKEKMLVWLS